MSGFNTLWLPGTDHAGIATQMIVEKELQRTEKKSRHDLGREEFLRRVWQWKERFGSRIGVQHQALGAALDWERERFTMDEGLSRAVREVFVRLYEEGLIYRAKKLINWCPRCHTALSDLEVTTRRRTRAAVELRLPGGRARTALARSSSPPPVPRRCWATPRWPSTPTTSATRRLIGKKVRHPLAGPRDPHHRRRHPGRPGLRHGRGQGHARPRLQRLRGRQAPRPRA